jgi:hypothetical protein
MFYTPLYRCNQCGSIQLRTPIEAENVVQLEEKLPSIPRIIIHRCTWIGCTTKPSGTLGVCELIAFQPEDLKD